MLTSQIARCSVASIFFFDDPHEGSRRISHNPSQARAGRPSPASPAARRGESGQSDRAVSQTGRLDQRRIARHDDRRPLLVGQRLAAHLDGMPGAQLLLLKHEFDVAVSLSQVPGGPRRPGTRRRRFVGGFRLFPGRRAQNGSSGGRRPGTKPWANRSSFGCPCRRPARRHMARRGEGSLIQVFPTVHGTGNAGIDLPDCQ